MLLNVTTAALNFYSSTRQNIDTVKEIIESVKGSSEKVSQTFEKASEGAKKVKQSAEEATVSLRKMTELLSQRGAPLGPSVSGPKVAPVINRTATPNLGALDAEIAKLRQASEAIKVSTQPVAEAFNTINAIGAPAAEAIKKVTRAIEDQNAVMSKRQAGDLLARLKAENDAIVASSVAEQKKAELQREQIKRAQELKKIEIERQVEQSRSIEFNQRIRQGAAREAFLEAEQARQAAFARGEGQRIAAQAETSLRRQAVAAREAASQLTVFERLKRGAIEFIKDEGGSSSFIEGLSGINNILEKVRPALADVSEKFLSTRSTVVGATVTFTGLAAAAGLVVGSLTAIGVTAAVALPLLIGIGSAGIKANSQLEQTQLGIASLIASIGDLRNAQGVKLDGLDALNAALPIARDQLEKLRVDALETSLTFEQLSAGFLQAVGPGLSAGLKLDQIRKTVIDISQIIVPLTGNAAQLGQELRSLFSGDIGPDSGVARALQITRGQIESAKESGKFAEFLNEKLKAAAATGKLMANTFEAAASNLKEAGTVLAATVTQGLFDTLKSRINTLLPQVFSTAGGKVAIAPAFQGLSDNLTTIFNKAGEAADAAIGKILDGIKGVSAFLAANRADIDQVINGISAVGGVVASTFVSVGSSVAEITAKIVLLGAKLAPVIAGLTTIGALLVAVQFGVFTRGITLAGIAVQGFLASLQAVKIALLDTAAFLLTTPTGLAILATSLGVAAVAYFAFRDAQQEAEKVTLDVIKAQVEQLKANEDLAAKAGAISDAVDRSAVEHERLTRVIQALDPATRAYVTSLGDEKTQLQKVNEELARRAQLSRDVLEAQFRVQALGFAENIKQIEEQKKAIDALQQAIKDVEQIRRSPEELVDLGNVDFNALSQDITKAQEKITEFDTKLKDNQSKLFALADGLKLNRDQFKLLAESVLNNKDRVNELLSAFDKFKNDQAAAASQTNTTTAALTSQANAIKDLKGAIDNLDSKAVDDALGKVVENIKKTAKTPAEAIKQLKEARKQQDAETGRQIVNEGIQFKQRLAGIDKAIQEYINPTKKTGQKSIFQQMTDELAAVNKQIAILQNVSGREFALKLKLDETRQFQQNLEKIVSLRRELNLPIKEALPTTAKGADGLLNRLEKFKQFKELAEKRLENPIPVSTFFNDKIAKEAKDEGETYIQLLESIRAKSPEVKQATVEQQLATGQLAEKYSKLNPLLKENVRLEAQDIDNKIAIADGLKQNEALQEQLSGKLSRARELTAEQTLAIELQSGKYKNLTEEQKKQRLEQARAIDTANAYSKQVEEAEKSAEKFRDTLSDLFGSLIDGPKKFFDNVLSLLKRTLAKMLGELLASQALRILGIVPGSGQAGAAGAPGAAGAASGKAGGLGGLLGGLSNILNIGRGSGGGGGPAPTGAITPPFAGGSIPGLGGAGNIVSLASKIPGLGGLGKLVAPKSASGATGIFANGEFAAGLKGQSSGAAATAGSLGVNFGALGATGLLSGGFVGGSLLGGSSSVGKLLGGAGGALGLGAVGATGIFGSGIASALPALFSNPITAIVAGGLIGGALLFNFLGNRTFGKFQDAVKNAYQVKVKGDQAGKSLFSEIEQIGKASFGKGFKDNIDSVVKSDRGREAIGNYAIATGQLNSSLAREFVNRTELTNAADPRNQFISRAFGGLVPGPDLGRDSVRAILRGEEFVARPEVVKREGVGKFQSLQNGQASIVRKGEESSGFPPILAAGLIGALEGIRAELARHRAMSPGDVIMKGAEENPDVITESVVSSFDRSTSASLAILRRIAPA